MSAPLAMTTWSSELAAHPWRAVVAVIVLSAGVLLAGVAMRALGRRSSSLRAQVLAVTLAGLLLGTVAAVALAWLMVLDGGDLATVVSILAVTSVFAVGLVVVATGPLGRDVRRLEDTVGRIEQGDRSARASLDRADELGHVSIAVDRLNQRLDDLERERAALEEERSTVLASISHDLRTPLTALRVAVEALADGVVDDSPRFLRAMQRDVEALSALVDDLFLLVRLEEGRLELEPRRIDLAEIADEAVEVLAPVALARDVTLRLETAGGVAVTADPNALGRVVRNLLDNAIRHAPPGTEVAVVVSSDRGRPTVEVVDAGEGFPPEFVGEAFDRFSRADASRTRSTGGAGLGLAIVQGLVEAHGGEVRVGSAPGGRVSFTLPA